MAALCPGVKYGLSTEENFSENKVLIFVKLTDSAISTVQQYLRNQNKFSKSPTIKFLGSEGQLSIPSQNNDTSKSFKFSMVSTADIEGPGGSFECLQQSGSPRGLQVLGSMPYKIQIQASEDVYETTRMRMTEAEENHKNKRTREIKPNQTDIGRKVKVKQFPGRTVAPPIRRETPSVRENVTKPSYQPSVPSKSIVHSNNGLSNGLGSNHVSSSRPQNKPSMPDIARRPIKERLIHLLALRPYKKPELYDRLNKEGLRERFAITSVLKQVAGLKDNSYHLNRSMWNDVHEDWPFYTESERQMLKRRKPQNLTPPGSSDGGSSGSGHSPTSTHPGSPPPPVSSSSSSSKRPGYYDGADGLPTKRQRISHYRKPSEQQQPYRSPVENNEQRRPVTDSRDASNMNPRSRESPTNEYTNPIMTLTNGYGSNHNDKRGGGNYSDDEDNVMNCNKQRVSDSHNSLKFGLTTGRRTEGPDVGREKTNFHNNSASNVNLVSLNSVGINGRSSSSPPVKNNLDIVLDNSRSGKDLLSERISIASNGNGATNGRNRQQEYIRERPTRWNDVTPVTQNGRIPTIQVSPDSQSERISETTESLNACDDLDTSISEFPDYLTEYTTIRDLDQRRKYKADFNADYAEYKKLHGLVEKVSRRFAELKDRLKQQDASSPKYKDLKKQIVREFQQNKQDVEHQKAKRRFQYLHDKLSHIKRLVLEYDQGVADSQY